MSGFNFAFIGDDIEDMDDDHSLTLSALPSPLSPLMQTSFRPHQPFPPGHFTPTSQIPPIAFAQISDSGSLRHPSRSAFPIPGQTPLVAQLHSLDLLLSDLPSKIAYSTLTVDTGNGPVCLPRRELWDVRVQLMAEDEGDGEAMAGLGKDDVKTGIYEGGFKSWESSVDLVKELASRRVTTMSAERTILEVS